MEIRRENGRAKIHPGEQMKAAAFVVLWEMMLTMMMEVYGWN
jgi:hypothetical protein